MSLSFKWRKLANPKNQYAINISSYFVDLSLPPRSLLIRKNVTLSKTWRGSGHANLVSTLGVTQCDSAGTKTIPDRAFVHT